MGKSWRIGIDQAETLELRTQGLFAVSRNPIFLGMLGLVVGLAIWSPTAVTVAALAVSYVALEVQIRAEEAYLERTLGDPYRAYRARTPRWL
jgi:protein-S-isoprenylcysteine O-methyltransferase Ste14